MERSIFFISIFLTISIVYCSESDKKIVSIDENYIKAFRAKYYDEPVEKLEDLDPRSEDVIAILSQIKDLEKKGFDLLNTVPENGATCSIQLKFYITAVVNRAKEQSDYCVLRNLKKETRRELNIEQKNCTLDVLESAQKQIDGMLPTVETCRLVE